MRGGNDDLDQMTAQTESTKVGPIRFWNPSNNCGVGQTNKRCVSSMRSRYAIFVMLTLLRPTIDNIRLVGPGQLQLYKKTLRDRWRDTNKEQRI